MNPSHHKYEGGCLLRTVRLWLIDESFINTIISLVLVRWYYERCVKVKHYYSSVKMSLKLAAFQT